MFVVAAALEIGIGTALAVVVDVVVAVAAVGVVVLGGLMMAAAGAGLGFGAGVLTLAAFIQAYLPPSPAAWVATALDIFFLTSSDMFLAVTPGPSFFLFFFAPPSSSMMPPLAPLVSTPSPLAAAVPFA